MCQAFFMREGIVRPDWIVSLDVHVNTEKLATLHHADWAGPGAGLIP